jgi:hypothetical protein
MKFYILKRPNSEYIFFIENDDSRTFIPKDEGNTDYQAYLTWVAEGNEAEEWSPENDGV